MIERHEYGSDPVVSVVISTIPSNDHSTTLTRLKNQDTNEEYEIIIVNDSSLNRCQARNHGISEARAEIIALTDDDCLPPNDWIQNITSAFSTGEEIACIEGSVEGGLNYNGNRHYLTCNLLFKRDEALKIDGFRSEYAGYREDTEFGWRMEEKADGICKFDESVRMVHPDRPRSNYNHNLNLKFKSEYPEKYDEVFNHDLIERVYMLLARFGIVGLFNRVYNRVAS